MRIHPIIAGNWKMNFTPSESEVFVGKCRNMLLDIERSQVIFCPPFTGLERAKNALQGSTHGLGAQNCHWESKGAYTGEISLEMLIDIGVQYVIAGHSERRHIFNESDSWINRKVKAILNADLTPILCIGETLEERNSGKTEQVIQTQLNQGLNGVPDISGIIIAYEPVWAIGTGVTATPGQAGEAHAIIRQTIRSIFGADNVDALRILYGGSVKPDNAEALIEIPGVDGFLIGGASLKAEDFSDIAHIVEHKYLRN
ncbi:MAG: triose-phosphate isomerase [FCB group bacterium]|nr:triose-phosphate isomerase [FCB group bacterium]